MSTIKNTGILILLAIGTFLSAQEISFKAIAPASVKEGQNFQYTIQGNSQGDIVLPEIPDFDNLAGPSYSFNSSTSVVNGRMTSETIVSYTYIFQAKKSGEFTIPPATIKVKKKNYTTNAVKISVSETGESDNISSNNLPPVFLRIIPSKKSVYIGEQFVSELKVYTSVNTRITNRLNDVPYEGFYKQSLDADNVSSREIIGGKEHITQVLQRHLLIPQKTGTIVIEAYESEWTVPQRVNNSSRSFWGDPFSIREIPQTLYTNPVNIEVKPLPGNAPKGFSGGVGDLKFQAQLSSTKAKVNDAISLVVKISGTGNIPLIGAPKIDFPPDHDVYETTKSSSVSTSGNRISGSLTFEYPIVVRHAGNFRIAPVQFSWFNPAKGRYETASSEEFNFTVEKGEGSDSEGQVYVPGLRAEMVEDIGTDILDIKRTTNFDPIGQSPFGKFSYWLIYILLFVAFVALLFILPVYFRHKADVRLVRNRKANKMAKSRLKNADKARKMEDSGRFFEETEKAIWGYLADKLSIELSSLSREKITEVLTEAGLSDEIKNELFRIMDDCEFSRYAPSKEKSDMGTLYSESIRLINNLEQNIQSR